MGVLEQLRKQVVDEVFEPYGVETLDFGAVHAVIDDWYPPSKRKKFRQLFDESVEQTALVLADRLTADELFSIINDSQQEWLKLLYRPINAFSTTGDFEDWLRHHVVERIFAM